MAEVYGEGGAQKGTTNWVIFAIVAVIALGLIYALFMR